MGTRQASARATASWAPTRMASTAAWGCMASTPPPRPSFTATVTMLGIRLRAKPHRAASPDRKGTGTPQYPAV